MRKLLASLAVLILFIPLASFAQSSNTTTYSPQYIALLEQLLQVLEQELASMQSSSTVSVPNEVSSSGTLASTTSKISSGVVSVVPGITAAYLTTSGMYYQLPLTIDNNTNTPIYVPTNVVQSSSNTPGFAYTLNGNVQGTVSSSVNCTPQSYVNEAFGSVQVCTIPAGTSVELNVDITIAPTLSGDASITLNSMSYAPDTSVAPTTWTLLPISNDTTSLIASGSVASSISTTCSTEYSNIENQVSNQLDAAGGFANESQIEEMATKDMENEYPNCGY